MIFRNLTARMATIILAKLPITGTGCWFLLRRCVGGREAWGQTKHNRARRLYTSCEDGGGGSDSIVDSGPTWLHYS